MIDDDPFEEFRDPQTYDLEDEGYYDDYPLTEQWARSLGGPLLDLACVAGRMALQSSSLLASRQPARKEWRNIPGWCSAPVFSLLQLLPRSFSPWPTVGRYSGYVVHNVTSKPL
jgi:hypothetical protein